MLAWPIPELWVHPAQLTVLKHSGQVDNLAIYKAEAGEDLYVTAHGQRVRVSRYLPSEGIFLPDSRAVIEAKKTTAGDVRRIRQLQEYRKNFPT